jgi:hypothetical protein
MRLPDFYIVGAPKCGTNSLFYYLRSHNRIFMPGIKEPQFFCSDFPDIRQVKSYRSYLELFRNVPNTVVAGEASVWYLFSQTAIENILSANPKAKLIAMLRNPVDMCCSLHGQFLRGLREDESDFEKAWMLQELRAQGKKLPQYCPEPSHLQYRSVASFSSQIERLKRIVPASQQKVIIFEDFIADPKKHYESTLSYLGVPTDQRTVFPAVNEGRQLLDIWIKVLSAISAVVPHPMGLRVKQIANDIGIRPMEILNNFATVKSKRPPLNPAFRRELLREFEADIRTLEELLGRSLSIWRR